MPRTRRPIMPLLARLAPALLLVVALALSAGVASEPIAPRFALADTLETERFDADTMNADALRADTLTADTLRADALGLDTLDAEPARDPALGDTLTFAEAARAPRLVGGSAGLEARARFSPEMIEQQTGGLAIVRFVVDEAGRPRGLRFVRSAGDALDAEARRLIETAEFEPGRVGRQTVPVQFTLPIRFVPPPRPEPVAGVGLDYSQPLTIPESGDPLPTGSDVHDPEPVGSEPADAPPPDESLADPDGDRPSDSAPHPVGGVEAVNARFVYPEEAQRAGLEGSIRVRFTVHADGSTSGHTCVRDHGLGSCEAAIAAIEASPFEPARAQGVAVDAPHEMVVRFRLR